MENERKSRHTLKIGKSLADILVEGGQADIITEREGIRTIRIGDKEYPVNEDETRIVHIPEAVAAKHKHKHKKGFFMKLWKWVRKIFKSC
ncbi:MAG: hypothetical protein H7844_07580 [Nitrospirae bacterium YQR-1]